MLPDHSRIQDIFLAACDLPEPEQNRFLDEHCSDDPELRRELQLLLRKDARQDGIFADDRITEGIEFQVDTVVNESAPGMPEMIGRYRVKKVLGQGGMGVVYLARQENPSRDVAVKVIRSGMVSPDLLKRFELEAAILGRLKHPGIANIYEAGVFVDQSTAQERPFLAMEYIEGKPLDRVREHSNFDKRDRLQLIVQICDAVHHAHQRGVIHRDLKPANVLVQADGQPSVLDFGIARVTGLEPGMSTLQTRAGQLIGTLPYMSPEQVRGHALDVDTRSDVYSLGVIAFELLSGTLPYDINEAKYLEAARIISEAPPKLLSTIDREFRGDVNTIILKALEKDPDRRYQSARALGDDIGRYLNHQPVLARPATAFYQMTQFAKRNKALVAGFLVSIALLVLGVIGTTVGMMNARQESARREAINEFMKDILASENSASGNPDIKMAEVLRDAAASAPERFSDYPELEAEVNHLLGNAFRKLTMYSEAAALYQRAYEIRKSELGLAHLLTRESGVEFTGTLVASDAASALELSKQLLEHTPLIESQGQNAMRLQIVIARAHFRLGEMELAEQEFRNILSTAGSADIIDEAILRNTRRHLADAIRRRVSLGWSENRQEEIQEAIELYHGLCSDSIRDFGEAHVETLQIMLKLGNALKESGETQEAEELCRHIIELATEQFDAEHDLVFQATKDLAKVLYWQNRYEEAADHHRAAIELNRRRTGRNSVDDLVTMRDGLAIVEAAGRFVEGEEYARILLEKLSGAYDNKRNIHRMYLARSLSGQGKKAESESEFEQLPASDALADHERCILLLFKGEHHLSNDNREQALELFEDALRLRRKLRPTEIPTISRYEESIERAALSD